MPDRRDCSNCWHGRKGHCSLFSCSCATAISNHEGFPPSWLDLHEGLTEVVGRVISKKEVNSGD